MTLHKDELLCELWRRIKTDDSTRTKYYIKFATQDKSFAVLVTDLLSVWEVECTENQIEKDIQRFCPQISMPITTVIHNIRSCLIDEWKQPYDVKITPTKDCLSLEINTSLLLQASATIPFQWRLDCTPVGRSVDDKTDEPITQGKKRRRGNDRRAIVIEDSQDQAEDAPQHAIEERLQQAETLVQHVTQPLLG